SACKRCRRANFSSLLTSSGRSAAGVPGRRLPDDVSKEEKFARLHRLQALVNEQANQIAQDMIGTEQTVLVERLSRRDENEIMGRTENNRIVNFPGNARLIGQMVKVRITEALTNTLRGEIITTDSVSGA
ncbi:MAG TPA: TRAM domain-containing protein, partial [Alcaligenaceae bacterium]|nr:TRAM domain-containing protein [Alcaligenaceae bacterium]